MARYYVLYGRDGLWQIVELGKFGDLRQLFVAVEEFMKRGYRFFEIEVVDSGL